MRPSTKERRSRIPFEGKGSSGIRCKTGMMFAIFAVIVISVSAAAVLSDDAEFSADGGMITVNGIDYYVTSPSTVEVGDNRDAVGEITIPMEIEDPIDTKKMYTVTGISKNAFYECAGITSLKILADITSVGEYAFYGCKALKEVTLSPGFKTLGVRMFDGSAIETVEMPGVEHIGKYAFLNCEYLESAEMPSAVSIGIEAFNGCESLTTLEIPDSVTSIDSSAFKGCTGLTSVTLPINIRLDNTMFDGVNNVGNIALTAGTTVPDGIVAGNGANYGSAVAGSPLHILSKNAETLTVVLNEGITYIGNNTFQECTNLTTLEIPESVTSISPSAFSNCTGMTSFTVHEDNTSFSSADGIIYDKEKERIVAYPAGKAATEYVNSVITMISSQAFRNCPNLTTVDTPNVKSIGNNAFSGCTGLTSMDAPEVESIGAYAFSGCTGLTSMETSKATTIAAGAFEGCIGLTSMDTSNATSIGASAFSGCTGLTSMDVSKATSIGDNVFKGCTGLEEIILLDVTHGANAFSGCNVLTTMTVIGSGNDVASNLLSRADPWVLEGQPEELTKIIIDGALLIPDTFTVKDDKTVQFTKGAKDTKGGTFYDTDGKTELTGASRAGRTFESAGGEWIALEKQDDGGDDNTMLYAAVAIAVIILAALAAAFLFRNRNRRE